MNEKRVFEAWKVDADYLPKRFKATHFGDRILTTIDGKGIETNRMVSSRGEQWFKDFETAVDFAHHAIQSNVYMGPAAKDAARFKLDRFAAEERAINRRKTSIER